MLLARDGDGSASDADELVLSDRRGLRVGLCLLDSDAGDDALHPAREPPVRVAEQLHRRGHEDDADDGRVDRDRDREARGR